MKSSSQKTGFSIAVMIGVIIVAGIAVDWWDAHQSRQGSRPVEVVQVDDAAVKRIMEENERLNAAVKRIVEENERLKTDHALLNMQNDALRKQIEEMAQRAAGTPKVEVVKGDKPPGD